MRRAFGLVATAILVMAALAACGNGGGGSAGGTKSYDSASAFVDALVSTLGDCDGLDPIVQPPPEENANPDDVLVYCAPVMGGWNKGQGAVRQNPEEARNLVCGSAKQAYPKVIGGNWDLSLSLEDAPLAASLASAMGGTVTTIGDFVGC